MGWSSTSLAPGETVRSRVEESYQGRPDACASCGWGPSSHPRVSGAEYDAIYGPRDDRPPPHEWAKYEPTYRVLDYARVGEAAYLAVLTIATGEISAGVCLISRRNGEVYTKAMDESMGPGECSCPARILALLSPTKSQYANEWRVRCRENLAAQAAKPKVVDGVTLRFSPPLLFANGAVQDVLTFSAGSIFRDEFGKRYSIPGWRKLRYRLAEAS